MINPVTSKTDLLRALKPGDRVIWVVDNGDIAKTQRQFSAMASQARISITQKTAVTVAVKGDEMPITCLIIEYANEALI